MIRKISFTGSTKVGKQLAALAGHHMKRVTMELGGHAPVIVFDDADIESAAKIMVAAKYRNAGQVCISPTRFLVQEGVYDKFIEQFVTAPNRSRSATASNRSTMGPLANARRMTAIEGMVQDAVGKGAKVAPAATASATRAISSSPPWSPTCRRRRAR